MKVLVTGGSGFLGRYIVKKLLSRGYEVRVFQRSRASDLAAQGVEVQQGNLHDPTAVSLAVTDRDAVIHVAAKAGVWGSWDSFFEPNVEGTRRIIATARASESCRYIVHTSTPSVVFTGAGFQGDDESLPYGSNWLCHYAHTKAIAEKEMLAANGVDGISTIALRPHLIWGTGDPHLLPRVIERARAGRLRIVGDGTNRVDITHVENAAQAHLDALDALMKDGTGAGKPYFISQGEPVQLWPWINDLLGRLDIPQVEKRISLGTAKRIGSLCETIWKLPFLHGEPPMTRFVATELGKNHWFDISAARRDLGYEPHISTEDGLEAYVRYLQR